MDLPQRWGRGSGPVHRATSHPLASAPSPREDEKSPHSTRQKAERWLGAPTGEVRGSPVTFGATACTQVLRAKNTPGRDPISHSWGPAALPLSVSQCHLEVPDEIPVGL